jgi:hypothetical protein
LLIEPGCLYSGYLGAEYVATIESARRWTDDHAQSKDPKERLVFVAVNRDFFRADALRVASRSVAVHRRASLQNRLAIPSYPPRWRTRLMKFPKLLAVTALLLGTAHVASAQILATQTQTVNVTVTAVDNFTVAGGAVSLSAGIGTTSDNSTASYSIQTNSDVARVIKAQITTGSNFPTGVSVTAAFAAPTTGTPTTVTLSTGNQDIVTGITHSDNTGLAITYSLTTTVAAVPATLTGRVITYTLQ